MNTASAIAATLGGAVSVVALLCICMVIHSDRRCRCALAARRCTELIASRPLSGGKAKWFAFGCCAERTGRMAVGLCAEFAHAVAAGICALCILCGTSSWVSYQWAPCPGMESRREKLCFAFAVCSRDSASQMPRATARRIRGVAMQRICGNPAPLWRIF